MKYSIKAIPTRYRHVLFRSRLEARWAAFFDLIHWEWEYEPFDLDGWIPDFLVSFRCGHSECPAGHSLLVEVKPYLTMAEFAGHPSQDYSYGSKGPYGSTVIPADSSASFGYHPRVSWWEFGHGAGGGVETLPQWLGLDDGEIDVLWEQAGLAVRYRRGES